MTFDDAELRLLLLALNYFSDCARAQGAASIAGRCSLYVAHDCGNLIERVEQHITDRRKGDV